MPIILTCAHCGKSFRDAPSRLRERNYCSARCRDVAWSLERGTFRETRQCPVCGGDFEVTSKNKKQVYCSEACRDLGVWGSVDERFAQALPHRPDNACWEWQGRMGGSGYGTIYINGREVPAHRFTYERMVGPIPEGMILRHTCDNPPCCNPAHLIPGTNQDNIRDKVERGRAQRIQGTQQKQAKLTERDIPIIRELIAERFTDRQIAAHFGVSETAINFIRKGKHWSHVP